MANLPTSQTDTTQLFFNGYFSQPIQISDAEYSQIYGFFYNLTNSPDSASSLSQSIITLAYNNNLNTLDLLKQFQANPNNNNIKNLLISFFNNAKGSTSKLGFKKNIKPPSMVTRNIIP